MNKIYFTGNIGSDAETKTLPSGKDVTEFDVAVTIGWGADKGTEWRRCSMWGDRGASLARYLTKGMKLAVTGTPSLQVWIGKQSGEAAGKICVRVDDVTLLGGHDGPGKPIESFDSADQGQKRPSTPVLSSEDDDDVPF